MFPTYVFVPKKSKINNSFTNKLYTTTIYQRLCLTACTTSINVTFPQSLLPLFLTEYIVLLISFVLV